MILKHGRPRFCFWIESRHRGYHYVRQKEGERHAAMIHASLEEAAIGLDESIREVARPVGSHPQTYADKDGNIILAFLQIGVLLS